MANLERALIDYRKNSNAATKFEISKVPITTAAPPREKEKGAAAPVSTVSTETRGKGESQDMYIAIIASIPQFASLNLGNLFKSSKPVDLTESETEYVVNVVKHSFPNHVVFQVFTILLK